MNKTSKRILAFILIFTLSFSLIACDSSKGPESDKDILSASLSEVIVEKLYSVLQGESPVEVNLLNPDKDKNEYKKYLGLDNPSDFYEAAICTSTNSDTFIICGYIKNTSDPQEVKRAIEASGKDFFNITLVKQYIVISYLGKDTSEYNIAEFLSKIAVVIKDVLQEQQLKDDLDN